MSSTREAKKKHTAGLNTDNDRVQKETGDSVIQTHQAVLWQQPGVGIWRSMQGWSADISLDNLRPSIDGGNAETPRCRQHAPGVLGLSIVSLAASSRLPPRGGERPGCHHEDPCMRENRSQWKRLWKWSIIQRTNSYQWSPLGSITTETIAPRGCSRDQQKVPEIEWSWFILNKEPWLIREDSFHHTMKQVCDRLEMG